VGNPSIRRQAVEISEQLGRRIGCLAARSLSSLACGAIGAEYGGRTGAVIASQLCSEAVSALPFCRSQPRYLEREQIPFQPFEQPVFQGFRQFYEMTGQPSAQQPRQQPRQPQRQPVPQPVVQPARQPVPFRGQFSFPSVVQGLSVFFSSGQGGTPSPSVSIGGVGVF
jgi:hypothetical protein